MFFELNEYSEEVMALVHQPKKVTRLFSLDTLRALRDSFRRTFAPVLAVATLLPILAGSWFGYKLAAYLLVISLKYLVVISVYGAVDHVKTLAAEVQLDDLVSRVKSGASRLWEASKRAAHSAVFALAELLPFALFSALLHRLILRLA
jgi:hypothetical protein